MDELDRPRRRERRRDVQQRFEEVALVRGFLGHIDGWQRQAARLRALRSSAVWPATRERAAASLDELLREVNSGCSEFERIAVGRETAGRVRDVYLSLQRLRSQLSEDRGEALRH